MFIVIVAAAPRRRGHHRVHHAVAVGQRRCAIRAFAGEDIEAAVLYPEDERYLIGESHITHYDVADHIT